MIANLLTPRLSACPPGFADVSLEFFCDVIHICLRSRPPQIHPSGSPLQSPVILQGYQGNALRFHKGDAVLRVLIYNV